MSDEIKISIRDIERMIGFWAENVHRIYGSSTSVFARLEDVPGDNNIPGDQPTYEIRSRPSYEFKMTDFRADIFDADVVMQSLTRSERTACFFDAINNDGYREQKGTAPNAFHHGAKMAHMSTGVFARNLRSAREKVSIILRSAIRVKAIRKIEESKRSKKSKPARPMSSSIRAVHKR